MNKRAKPNKETEWTLRPESRERRNREWAAHYVTEQFPVVPDTWSIGDIHEYITSRSRELDVIDYIYVVNSARKLVGVLSMRDIFSHAKKTDVKTVMKREIITVAPETHRERVAQLALYHHLRAIPVVKNQKLEGVILTNTLLQMINRALRENLLTFSGVHKAHLEYDDTMHVPLLESFLHRAPWLIVGLVGVLFAAGIIDQFASILNKHLILAFFIPAIVYMSDALGTQNQTLLIRDLAVMGKDLKLAPYFAKTMVIALAISALIGTLVYAMTAIFWGETGTAFVIALAMFATLLISGATSILTTLLFRKLGQDPALGSGPFATIVSDVTSIIVYFVIVSALL